mgnify:CR=1 FL=1
MEKAKKAEVVEDLNKVFTKAGSVVVAHYSGMTVAQMADLRSRMGAAGARGYPAGPRSRSMPGGRATHSRAADATTRSARCSAGIGLRWVSASI